MPSVSVLDERDAAVIETCAAELRALLPPEGPVLVLGIGNRRVTADSPRPAHGAEDLVTMGPQHTLPVKGIRPVAAIAPGVSASTGLTLRQLAGAMVEAVRPAALICVDSLCSAEGARLGRSVQFSDTGLYPAQADHAKHLDAAALGVPVIAAGIPHLDGFGRRSRSCGHAPGAGQRDRPRLGSSGRCHQPGLAAKAQRGAAVLAGGVTPVGRKGGYFMRSKALPPARAQGHIVPFLEAAALFAALCIFARTAALMLAAAITAPLPMAETLFWLGRQSAQEQPASSVQVEAAPDSTPEAAASSLPQAVQALTGNIEDYLVPLLGEEARPADAGTVIEKNYPQGSGEKYIPCGAGSIKNNTRQTAADIAAEIENPLPFAIEQDSPRPAGAGDAHSRHRGLPPFGRAVVSPGDGARSTDRSVNMCAVGRVVADTLNAAGINTLHDETLNDYPSYTGSYANSRAWCSTGTGPVPQHQGGAGCPPGRHRDRKRHPLCPGVHGGRAAGRAGHDHLRVRQRHHRSAAGLAAEPALCRCVGAQHGRDVPRFTRPVLFSYRFYNQDLTTGSLLIEIGGHGNNLNEALYAGQLAAKGLAAALLGGA